MGELFDFSQALNMLKQGKKVSRTGWKKGVFLYMVNGSEFKVSRSPLLGTYPEGTTIRYESHIDIKLANGNIMTWAPSQVDIFGEDWSEVD